MKISNYYWLYHRQQIFNYQFKGHRHGMYEANIILNGAIELTCGSNVYLVNQGHFAIWKPGVFHMSRVVSEEGCNLIAMQFDLSENTFPSEESAVFQLNETDLSLSSVMLDSTGDALKKLTEAFLMRISDREGCAETSNSGLSDIYHTAVNFMADRLCDDIDVTTVAKHCGVCLTTLKKVFSTYTGKGVWTYFVDMKIHAAKEMLRGENSVTKISDLLGFSSPAYFSQCFKRETGVSPAEYKKSHAGK